MGWLLVWLEKEVTLRSRLNTKFGLEEKEMKEDEENNQEESKQDEEKQDKARA